MEKPYRLLPLAAMLMTLGLQAGCASTGSGAAPGRANALDATGSSGEAYASSQSASTASPEDAELQKASAQARQLHIRRLESWASAALDAGQPAEAMEAYRQLAAIPGYADLARAGMEKVRARNPGKVTPVDAPMQRSLRLGELGDPVPVAASADLGPRPAPVAARLPADPKSATPVSEPLHREAAPLERKVTLEFRNASVRSLFDVITRTSGLNVIFDRDVPQELTTTVFLRNTTVRSAIEKIVLTSGLAWRQLDANTLLVYMDDASKQRDYQSLEVRSFQLANADAKFVANSLKTVLRFRDVVVDDKLNMIVVRDTPAALAMAEKLIAMHDVPEPEVMLDVAIVEVSKGKLQSLGVAWPGSMSLTPIARTYGTTSSTTDTTSGFVSSNSTNTLTLRDLYNLTPGTLGMGLGATTLNFNATDNSVNVLANPRIRAKNREKAKILIGERVPNISATATSNGVVSQNINYVDVGLKLDVEPQIYPGNEISLKINMEVSSINSTVENKTNGMVAYRIGTRNASTVLRLKDGENQILAGLIQDTDRKSVTKVPLLGDIPILGHLFRSDSDDKGKNEIVLSITPRLIRGNQMRADVQNSFDAGTVSSVRGRRDGDAGGGGAPETAPAAQPVQQIQIVPAFGGQGGGNGNGGYGQSGSTGERQFGGSVD